MHYPSRHIAYSPLGLAVIICLCLVGCLTLSSCASSNDEQVIEESVKSEFDGLASRSGQTVERVVDYMDLDELGVFGVKGSEFAELLLEDLDYRIDGIEIAEDRAEATVTITCRSYSAFMTTLTEERDAFLTQVEASHTPKAQAALQAGALILETLENTPLEECEPVTIAYVKHGSTWQPSESAHEDIALTLLTS